MQATLDDTVLHVDTFTSPEADADVARELAAEGWQVDPDPPEPTGAERPR